MLEQNFLFLFPSLRLAFRKLITLLYSAIRLFLNLAARVKFKSVSRGAHF